MLAKHASSGLEDKNLAIEMASTTVTVFTLSQGAAKHEMAVQKRFASL